MRHTQRSSFNSCGMSKLFAKSSQVKGSSFASTNSRSISCAFLRRVLPFGKSCKQAQTMQAWRACREVATSKYTLKWAGLDGWLRLLRLQKVIGARWSQSGWPRESRKVRWKPGLQAVDTPLLPKSAPLPLPNRKPHKCANTRKMSQATTLAQPFR